MKKYYITLFFALVLSTLSFAQNFSAIEPELQKVLNQRGEELIDIQIYFKSSIDSKQLNQATRKAYTKSEKKELVVSELKTYSKNVQADVMSILKAEELSGNASDIHNLWIANSINCKASRSVIYKLSSHPDVKMIGYDKEIQIISPEQMKAVEGNTVAPVRGADAHVSAVNAPQVWSLGYTGKNVIVAVLDSGTNTNHLDLKDHLWSGYVDTNNDGTPDSYVNGWNYISNNSNITDDYGHGTHCAGIVCGDGTAGFTTGVAPDASLMTLKTVNRTGGGSVAQMLSGVQFAVENGADILSMSLGFKNDQITTAQKEEIRKAFDNVLAAGVVVCAAAGNDGDTYGAPDNVDYPAACPAPWRNPDQTLEGGLSSVICVGAHDLATSSRGPSTWEGTSYNDYPYNGGESMGLIRPDISAPGYFIRSTKYNKNDIYEIKQGTSQATPNVAGVIALMLEKNSTLTPAQISEIIETTATSKPATKNNTVGAGIVNALAAVNSITEVVGNPYIGLNTFAPAEIATGNQTIGVTLKNKGNGPSDENTTVTLALANDPYVTIVAPTQSLGKIGVNNTKTLFFDINVAENTPSGHTITFDTETTDGTFSWKDVFSVKVKTVPHITFKSVTPSVVNVGSTSDISVTIVNDGTAAFTDSVKLTLIGLAGDANYVTIVDKETAIKPLGVGEIGSGTFTIQTNSIPYSFDFFLDTYSEYTNTTSYIYEFENDMEGWTSFNASSNNNINKPWWHSSEAVSFGKEAFESHSGNGHLMSNASLMTSWYTHPINNYLVSPVKVKVTENSKVSFYARAYGDGYLYPEHFGLSVSTTGNTSANDFTLLKDWVISDKESSTTWKEYSVDLSAYAGQEVYVAIRHFFTAQEWEETMQGYDLYALNIDDITFSNVSMNIQHTSTLSYDDPYYFTVKARIINSLPKVQNFTAIAINNSEIELTWDAMAEAAYYTIYQGTNTVATNVTGSKYIVTGLQAETEYCYNIVAVSSAGQSEYSDLACATTFNPENEPVDPEQPVDPDQPGEGEDPEQPVDPDQPGEGEDPEQPVDPDQPGDEPEEPGDEPTAPTLAAPVVTATATSDSTIVLTWNKVENAIRYNIYKGDEDVKLAVYDTTYTVTGLEANTQYCFNVVSVNREGISEKSADACATTLETEEPEEPEDSTLLAAPTNLRATVRQDVPGFNYKFEITMMWDAVVGAKGYDIYVNTADTTGFHMGYTNGTAYVAGTDKEATLEFYVVAFNDSIDSKPSEPCTITIVDDAIEELEASFNIYPNPANDKLYIETLTQTQTLTVEIYDVYGRQQTTDNGQQLSCIDVSKLNSGVYFVKVITSNGEVIKRFVKK